MQQHQPNWRRLILVFIVVASVVTLALYKILGIVEWRGVWVGFTKIGVVATTVFGLWEVFRRWLWRWKWFRNWLVDIPDLNGRWLGTASSSYVDTVTGEQEKPIKVHLEIIQTFTNISIAFNALTLTSHSNSVTANFIIDPETGRCRLIYTYLNEPSVLVSDLDMHYGTAILDIHGSPPDRLTGKYLTGRKEQTKGTLEFTRQSN
jgi:hypothetical protein